MELHDGGELEQPGVGINLDRGAEVQVGVIRGYQRLAILHPVNRKDRGLSLINPDQTDQRLTDPEEDSNPPWR